MNNQSNVPELMRMKQEDPIPISQNQEQSQICNKSNGNKAFMLIWFLTSRRSR